MNNFIAQSNKFQRKFIGAIVSVGSVVAFSLAAVLITSGIVLFACQHAPSQDFFGKSLYVVMWSVAGLFIAVLIERLTTTNSTKWRISREKESAVKEKYDKIEEEEGALTDIVLANKIREITKSKEGRKAAIVAVIFGAVLSMMCEGFTIHLLFVTWEPIEGFLGSLFLSGLVSYTLIAAELHKSLDNEVLNDSLMADNLLKVAAQANIKDKVSSEILSQASTKVEEILQNNVIATSVDEAVVMQIDEVMGGNGRIASAINNDRDRQQYLVELEDAKSQRQLTLLRGGVVDASQKSENPVVGNRSSNYRKIEGLYKELGEKYFTSERKKKLAEEMGITTRSVERFLVQAKESIA